MRPRRVWLATAFVGALVACSRRPLPFDEEMPVEDAGRDVGQAVDAGADAASEARPGVLDWAVAVGSQPAPDAAGSTTLKAVVATDDGGAIVAGSFTGSVAFAPDVVRDGSPGAGFVARYRSDQRLVWLQVLNADRLGMDDGHLVVADMAWLGDGEIVVAGWFDGRLAAQRDVSPMGATSAGGLDAFVARLASDGSVRWMKRAGGTGDDIARGVAASIDPSGSTSIAITGAISDGAVFGQGEAGETRVPLAGGPIFAARLNEDGQLAWARFAGGGVPAQGYGVAHDSAGAVVVTGYVNGVAAFGDNISGAPISIDPADGRAFVARWDVAGRLLWAQPMGGPDGEGDAIAVAAGGAIVATGLFKGQARFGAGAGAPTLTADSPGREGCYVAAFTPAGATMWARRLVGIGLHPWRLRAGAGGDLLVAASFGGGIVVDPDGASPLTIFASGGTDAVFVRLDRNGALRWATAGGGPGDDLGGDFADARDGTSWAVGKYFGPALFGEGSAFGAGASARLESGTDGSSFLLRLLAPSP